MFCRWALLGMGVGGVQGGASRWEARVLPWGAASHPVSCGTPFPRLHGRISGVFAFCWGPLWLDCPHRSSVNLQRSIRHVNVRGWFVTSKPQAREMKTWDKSCPPQKAGCSQQAKTALPVRPLGTTEKTFDAQESCLQTSLEASFLTGGGKGFLGLASLLSVCLSQGI